MKSQQRFRRGGHHAGHLRDTFTNAVYQYHDWYFANDRGIADDLLIVEHEIDYEPVKIPMEKAFGLCWNCTDILPSMTVNLIEDFLEGNDPPHDRMQMVTYAAAARLLLAHLKEQKAEVKHDDQSRRRFD